MKPLDPYKILSQNDDIQRVNTALLDNDNEAKDMLKWQNWDKANLVANQQILLRENISGDLGWISNGEADQSIMF